MELLQQTSLMIHYLLIISYKGSKACYVGVKSARCSIETSTNMVRICNGKCYIAEQNIFSLVPFHITEIHWLSLC